MIGSPGVAGLVAFGWAPAVLSAAVIQGIVLEDRTGHPLARTQVRLERIQAAGASQTASVLTDRSGRFSFPTLAAGAYVLSASRAGFADSQYGQARSAGLGTPIAVEGESVFFAEVRLKRLGSVSGTIWDENQVGLPQVSVHVYRARRPLRLVSSSVTDDRGIFRVPGLPAGRYYVRSSARNLEDGTGLLPTFFPQSSAIQDAKMVDVGLDQDTPDVHIPPLLGRLGRIEGSVVAPQFQNEPMQVAVTLFSDTGRSNVYIDPQGLFQVDQLAPGAYELLAEARIRGRLFADFQVIHVTDRSALVGLRLFEAPKISLQIVDQEGKPVSPDRIVVSARRKEPAGEGIPQNLRADGSQLAPGNWEVSITTPPDLYLVSLSAAEPLWLARGSVEDSHWIPVGVPQWTSRPWLVELSTRPGTLQGRVTDSTGNPAIGAPVFLLAISADVRRRAGGLRLARANQDGEYRFAGLPPGEYRVMSSFEFEEPDDDAFQLAKAPTTLLAEGSQQTLRLTLWANR